MVKFLEVHFCDNGIGFWRLINAVWPDMWAKTGDDDLMLCVHHQDCSPVEFFMEKLVDSRCGPAYEREFAVVASQFWPGRSVFAPCPGLERDDDPYVEIGDVSVSKNAARFSFHRCGGDLDVTLLDSRRQSWGKNVPLEYSVKWSFHESYIFGDLTRGLASYSLFARNIVMSYLLTGANGYLTMEGKGVDITTKNVAEALRRYLLR